MRAAIMRLRSDPAASATMAGAFTRNNAAQLAATIGRMPTEGELYIAHFLGSDGAAQADQWRGARSRARMRPRCFRRPRRPIPHFPEPSGQPRSAGEVYATLTGRFEVARAMTPRRRCAAPPTRKHRRPTPPA